MNGGFSIRNTKWTMEYALPRTEEIITKMAYKNVDLFLKRYFHDDYLLAGNVHF